MGLNCHSGEEIGKMKRAFDQLWPSMFLISKEMSGEKVKGVSLSPKVVVRRLTPHQISQETKPKIFQNSEENKPKDSQDSQEIKSKPSKKPRKRIIVSDSDTEEDTSLPDLLTETISESEDLSEASEESESEISASEVVVKKSVPKPVLSDNVDHDLLKNIKDQGIASLVKSLNTLPSTDKLSTPLEREKFFEFFKNQAKNVKSSNTYEDNDEKRSGHFQTASSFSTSHTKERTESGKFKSRPKQNSEKDSKLYRASKSTTSEKSSKVVTPIKISMKETSPSKTSKKDTPKCKTVLIERKEAKSKKKESATPSEMSSPKKGIKRKPSPIPNKPMVVVSHDVLFNSKKIATEETMKSLQKKPEPTPVPEIKEAEAKPSLLSLELFFFTQLKDEKLTKSVSSLKAVEDVKYVGRKLNNVLSNLKKHKRDLERELEEEIKNLKKKYEDKIQKVDENIKDYQEVDYWIDDELSIMRDNNKECNEDLKEKIRKLFPYSDSNEESSAKAIPNTKDTPLKAKIKTAGTVAISPMQLASSKFSASAFPPVVVPSNSSSCDQAPPTDNTSTNKNKTMAKNKPKKKLDNSVALLKILPAPPQNRFLMEALTSNEEERSDKSTATLPSSAMPEVTVSYGKKVVPPNSQPMIRIFKEANVEYFGGKGSTVTVTPAVSDGQETSGIRNSTESSEEQVNSSDPNTVGSHIAEFIQNSMMSSLPPCTSVIQYKRSEKNIPSGQASCSNTNSAPNSDISHSDKAIPSISTSSSLNTQPQQMTIVSSMAGHHQLNVTPLSQQSTNSQQTQQQNLYLQTQQQRNTNFSFQSLPNNTAAVIHNNPQQKQILQQQQQQQQQNLSQQQQKLTQQQQQKLKQQNQQQHQQSLQQHQQQNLSQLKQMLQRNKTLPKQLQQNLLTLPTRQQPQQLKQQVQPTRQQPQQLQVQQPQQQVQPTRQQPQQLQVQQPQQQLQQTKPQSQPLHLQQPQQSVQPIRPQSQQLQLQPVQSSQQLASGYQMQQNHMPNLVNQIMQVPTTGLFIQQQPQQSSAMSLSQSQQIQPISYIQQQKQQQQPFIGQSQYPVVLASNSSALPTYSQAVATNQLPTYQTNTQQHQQQQHHQQQLHQIHNQFQYTSSVSQVSISSSNQSQSYGGINQNRGRHVQQRPHVAQAPNTSTTTTTPARSSPQMMMPMISSSYSLAPGANNENVAAEQFDLAVDLSKENCFICGNQAKVLCCGQFVYCEDDCQQIDYERHKSECRKIL